MNGEEVISLQFEGSYLSIFPPFWCFLFSVGEESSSMIETLDDRREKKRENE